MDSQFNHNIAAHKLNPVSDVEPNDVLKSISALEKSRHEKPGYSDDELILALQNRRENCRARQVFEWETARRQTPPQNYLRGAA